MCCDCEDAGGVHAKSNEIAYLKRQLKQQREMTNKFQALAGGVIEDLGDTADENDDLQYTNGRLTDMNDQYGQMIDDHCENLGQMYSGR